MPGPVFSERPPSTAGLPHIQIVRAPSSGELRVLATSTKPLAVKTHWWQGQTFPCVESDCPGCAAKRPGEWHVYAGGIRSNDRAPVIVEFTHGASEQIYKWLDSGEPLRGTILAISRAQKRANGRVVVKFDGTRRLELSVPEEFSLRDHLMKIWFGDDILLEDQASTWQERIARRLARRAERRRNGSVNGTTDQVPGLQ
jgi:hypothetical protein